MPAAGPALTRQLAMADEWTGQDIDGRYVVESVLGRGGMGIVLRAHHRFTGAAVAVKMLHGELSGDARMQERFLTECRAAAAIGHPAIAQVLDAGKTPDGELYLVMELLEGRSLRAAMTGVAPGPATDAMTGDGPRRDRRLPPEAARRIGLALLDALGAAHARGFVHRDLKPENVFLAGPAGTVKLLDFGVAKSLTGTSSYTAAGIVLGTVSYMAPEQLADASTVDGRADLWAVGVMLYELLAGALPYRASNLGEMMSALTLSEPVPIGVHLPGADPSVHAFFARALARDRAQRFATAYDMAQALAAAAIETAVPPPQTMGGMPTTASGETDPQRAARRFPAPADVQPPAQPLGPRPAPIPMVRPLAPSISPAPRRAAPGRSAPDPERRWLALSIAAVAVVAIAAGVIAIATSGHGRSAAAAVAPDRSSALAISADDPAASSGDGSIEAASPAPGHRTGAASTPEALCEAACRSGCGVEGPDCARLCLADPRAIRCLETTGTNDCAAWSRCVVGASCNGAPPRGERSCQEARACEQACRDNIACGCSCMEQMAPAHALAMVRLSTCALFMCANDAACVRAQCKAPLTACEAR
jgi:eukaryotic-like serine/threonine-protein kinase